MQILVEQLSTADELELPRVNAFGFYFGETTWARHARAFFTALNRRRPVALFPLDLSQDVESLMPEDRHLLGRRERPDEVHPGICIGPIESMSSVKGCRRIAFVVWETTVLPNSKRELLQTMDEIWTPSVWGRNLLIENGLSAELIFVVPEGVDTEVFRPREDASVTKRSSPFRLLCVGKWEVRKGVEDLVRCFAEEFQPEEEIELVLHGSNPWLYGFDLQKKIAEVLRGSQARVVASLPMPESELLELYRSCDAFVLPTRAEGWGLPIMEAMACGLPVIVTNYSAPADFLDESIAYPLAVEKMVSVHDPYFFPDGAANGEWAQPDFAHLRTLMRHVFEHREEAASKGRLARQAVRSKWTWDHAAEKACIVLDRDRTNG